MTIEEYKKLLNDHDWGYIMSEDFSVYTRGNREHNELLRLSNDSPEFRRLFRERSTIENARLSYR